MAYLQLTARIQPVQPFSDILISELADIGFESFEEGQEGIKAWIQEELFSADGLEQLEILRNPEATINLEINKVPDQNWNEEWEKNFQPIILNDQAIIRASFHQTAHYPYTFLISPKMAFGTGHHETTWLMSNALFGLDLKGKTVLDMGCGTGILAVIAEKLGASRILAVDIEAPAIENTLEHAQLNQCEAIEARLGGAEAAANEIFDVILANINRNVLTRDMNQYVQNLKNGGLILFSGFFTTDVAIIANCANNLGLQLVKENSKNNWSQLLFQKLP